MAGVGTGKYLENVSYPYADAVSMLVLREGRGTGGSPCWEGQAGPGNAAWRKRSCWGQVKEEEERHTFLGENQGTIDTGMQQDGEKDIHLPDAQDCWHLQSLGADRGAGPPGGQSCFRPVAEEDENISKKQNRVLAQGRGALLSLTCTNIL